MLIRKVVFAIIKIVACIIGYDLPLLMDSGKHKPWVGLRIGDK